jgi:hypothetical protein
MKNEYPDLYEIAMIRVFLLSFPITYFCETAFSAMAAYNETEEPPATF